MTIRQQDKQAEQQANLNILTDILEDYQDNLDNAKYLLNYQMKVLDIKQAAAKNLIFYQERIAAMIKKMPVLHRDKTVHDIVTNLVKQFSHYRMALYIYSFASFLEVMLLGNFRQAYLDRVAERVQAYWLCYQTQFSKCYDMMKQYSLESVETKLQEGIGKKEKEIWTIVNKVDKRNHEKNKFSA